MSKLIAKPTPAAIKLSDAQRLLLMAAMQREDRCLTRLPSLRGAQAAKLGETLIAAGYAREVKAKAEAPVWRRDSETGAAFALKLMAVGVKAITAEGPLPSKKVADRADASSITEETPSSEAQVSGQQEPASAPTRIQGAPRSTSKIATVIGLLSRVEGATLAQLIAATGWLPHTTRAALTGLRKRGYVLILERADRQQGSVYRIASEPDRDGRKSTERVDEAA